MKTDNNGKGKTLIFLGKAINIYIDDLDKFHNEDKGISMAVEESEFNKKTKNEIIYTFDDMFLKTKKRNMTINNNNNLEVNKLKNKNQIFNNKIIKNNFNSNQKNHKNHYRYLSFGKNYKSRKQIYSQKPNVNNLFNNYNKYSNKLPAIKLEKVNFTERKISKAKNIENKDYPNINDNKNEKKDPQRIYPITTKIKRPKKSSYSFYNFGRENISKSHKKVINFFTKENSDFYY